jgi:hypothetical protein
MTQAAVLASNASLMTTPSGTAPGYMARAWVNFNGTGTVAIRASGNVTSSTDNGVGNYTVNITNALPDANYAISGTSAAGTDQMYVVIPFDDVTARTTSACRFIVRYINGAGQPNVDSTNINIVIHR